MRPLPFYLFLRLRFANSLVLIVTKADVEAHFKNHGTGEIINVGNGFGILEYKEARDAHSIVTGLCSCILSA
jgi:hypothetical protein